MYRVFREFNRAQLISYNRIFNLQILLACFNRILDLQILLACFYLKIHDFFYKHLVI